MTSFFEVIPTSIFTEILGDDVVYHDIAGDIAIRAMVDDYIEPAFANETHISERRKKISIAIADAPGLKRKSELSHNGTRYVVDDIIANDGQFIDCVLRKK